MPSVSSNKLCKKSPLPLAISKGSFFISCLTENPEFTRGWMPRCWNNTAPRQRAWSNRKVCSCYRTPSLLGDIYLSKSFYCALTYSERCNTIEYISLFGGSYAKKTVIGSSRLFLLCFSRAGSCLLPSGLSNVFRESFLSERYKYIHIHTQTNL